MKRKTFWLLVLAAGGLLRLGIECFPEPDISFDLLSFLTPAA